jgi:hypothetical protein
MFSKRRIAQLSFFFLRRSFFAERFSVAALYERRITPAVIDRRYSRNNE